MVQASVTALLLLLNRVQLSLYAAAATAASTAAATASGVICTYITAQVSVTALL
jgi:hypothetical protein